MSDDTEKNETRSDEAEVPEAPDSADEGAAESAPEGEPEAAAEAPAAEPETEASAEGGEESAAEETAEPAAEAAAAEPAAEEAAAEPAAEEAAAEPAAEEAAAEPAAEAPEYDYHALHHMNVAQLREVAATLDHEAVHGYTTMHKEHLVPALCKALGIEAHEHHEVVGIDKDSVKAKIRLLKKERDEAEAAGDSAKLKLTRRRIRSLKRKIRKATV